MWVLLEVMAIHNRGKPGDCGDPVSCVLLLQKWWCVFLAEIGWNHTARASWLRGMELRGMGACLLGREGPHVKPRSPKNLF